MTPVLFMIRLMSIVVAVMIGLVSVLVYRRLHTFNLTVSHLSMIRLLDKIGMGFDDRVKEWRDSLLANVTDKDEIVTEQ